MWGRIAHPQLPRSIRNSARLATLAVGGGPEPDAPLVIVGEGINEIQRNIITSQLIARGGVTT